MGLRNSSVRVRRGELFIEAEVFYPKQWKWVLERVRAPLVDLRLSEPKLGKKGGFKYAELNGPDGTIWMFFNEHRHLYAKVKAVLSRRTL